MSGVCFMIELDLRDIKPGMITAKSVQTPRGQLIVNANIKLTDVLIKRIAFYSIPKVCVYEQEVESLDTAAPEVPVEPDVPIEPDVSAEVQPDDLPVEAAPSPAPSAARSDQVLDNRLRKTQQFQQFQLDYSKNIASCHQIFRATTEGGMPINTADLYQQTFTLIGPLSTSIEMFDMLHNIRQVDDSVYAHSINVSMIAYNIGRWLKFSESDLQVLTVAGLLHDIGKTQIDPKILNKAGKLTDEEFDIIRSHPRLGYEILKDQPIDSRIKKATLMHHERCDGSGYPTGVTAEYIDDFALIIAIADVYDAMTAARTYRAPLCPFQVIESFEREGLQKYKPKFILTFLNRIANTYQKSRVMLSNGKSGNIVLINDKNLSKPIIELNDGSFLDLSKASGISIVSVF